MANTEKLGLPLIEPNMTADVPRDMNALAEAVDAKVGVAGGLAVLGADGKVPTDQLNVKDPVDASTTQKGIVQLSEATDSTSNMMAATPKAVNTAQSNAKQYTDNYAAPKQHSHTAVDLPNATTTGRGVVQLNTSTSSTATDQAATPSAVKAAYDRAEQAFRSGADAKQIAVDNINAKRGSASTAMSWGEIGTAIRNISPVKATINQSYQITNNPSEAGKFVYGQKWFVFPANTTIICFTPTDAVVGTMDSYLKITRNNATEDGGTPIWRLEDANGVGVNCEMVKSLAGADESKSIRSWTLDARNREVTVIYYKYHAQGIMRTETINIPSNFDFNREISLWAGGRMGSNTSPAVYSVALKGNLLYM